MLWWFVILGLSTVVVVSAAAALYVRVRRQMKVAAAQRAEMSQHDRMEPPES
jgi:hypothetical protein